MRPGDDEEEKKEPVTAPVQTDVDDVYKQKEAYLNNTPTEKKEPLPYVGEVDVTKAEGLPLTFANRQDELQYKVNQGTWMTDPMIRWNEVKGMLPNMTGAQALQQINEAREKAGKKPMTRTELLNFLGDGDPYKTEKERKKERRRELWAEGITQLGEILKAAHNYGLAKRTGHYVEPPKGPTVGLAQRLREASTAQAEKNRALLNNIMEQQEARQYAAEQRRQERQEQREYAAEQRELDNQEKVNNLILGSQLRREEEEERQANREKLAELKGKTTKPAKGNGGSGSPSSPGGSGGSGGAGGNGGTGGIKTKSGKYAVYGKNGKSVEYSDLDKAYIAMLREKGIKPGDAAYRDAILNKPSNTEIIALIEAHNAEMQKGKK